MASSSVIAAVPNDTVVEMQVESGSTGRSVVSKLIPGLQNDMNNHHERHKIVTAGQEGIGTGTINCSVTDQDGNEILWNSRAQSGQGLGSTTVQGPSRQRNETQHLLVIGARSFVQIDTYKRKLDPTPEKGASSGIAATARISGYTIHL